MHESPLTPERWRTTEEILVAAWDVPAAERDRFLEERCAGDDELLTEVRTLLAAAEQLKGWEAPPADAPGGQPGRRIGPFELERLIGRGGMGAVYLAHRVDGQFEQKVAIKVIGLPFEIESFRERFRRERQILAGLNHPNITRLLDGGVTSDGELFLAMEYVDGIPLVEYCQQPGRSIEERLRIFREICGAVQYAHQNLIIHRDIKPSNILVDRDGTPILLDFGTAKLMAETEMTQTGLGMMSISYASPEQLRGEAVSTLTDVFSLGAVLVEMLTGVKLFTNTLAARMADTGTPALPATLDGELSQIAAKALAFDPAQRYPSVEQFSEDIRRYLDGEPVLAHPPGWFYRSSKFVRRHPWNMALSAMFVLGMTVAVVFSLHQATLARREAARSQHITTFLTDVFGAPNPGWMNTLKSRGKNVTVLEVVNELRSQLGNDLAQEPEVEVDLRRAVGQMYSGIGDHEAAREQLALALSRQLADKNADRTLTAKLYVARAWEESLTLRSKDVLADASAALDLLGKRGVPSDREIRMGAYNLVAFANYALGKSNEVEQPALEALRLSRELYGDEGYTPVGLTVLATSYYTQSRYEESERYAREAWAIYQRQQSRSGKMPVEGHGPAQILGAMCMEKKDYICAKEFLDQAQKIATDGYGPESPNAVSIRGQQGVLLGLMGQLEESRRELGAYRQSMVKLAGRDSPYVAQGDAASGRVELAAGNFTAAELYLRRAYEAYQTKFPKDDVRTLALASRLGECLAAEGKRDEGLRLLQASHQALLAKLGPKNLLTTQAADRLAAALKVK